LHVDIDKLDLVGRLHGADWYLGLGDRFQEPRQTLDGWRARSTIPEGEVS